LGGLEGACMVMTAWDEIMAAVYMVGGICDADRSGRDGSR
jgi:hypothetical protein